ncbi:MAG TPA: hypothetical protein VJP85_10970 [Candidatus Baltobacteraceae bacterium]|nr:hypothetical protein [Candidatus Baltobacteraceae bacterium]
MKFLREWLRVQRPPGVATHASQTVDVDLTYAQAFHRCVRGIEDVLGGAVREADDRRGTIEATFGLINSERLTCTLSRMEGDRTRILIESRRGISAEPAKPSPYVRALAEFLTKPE